METIKKAIDCDYREEEIDEERRKNSVSSSEDARNDFLDETRQFHGDRDENKECNMAEVAEMKG